MLNLHYGLQIWEVEPRTMQAQAHQHNEIELIYIEQGRVSYMYHADTLTLKSGDLIIFWAAIPHQLLAILEQCTMHIITIPLSNVIQWGLSKLFMDKIMSGKPVIQNDLLANPRIIEMYFRQWQRDLLMASQERREIVLLELHALLKRWCLYLDTAKNLRLNNQESPRSTTQIHAQTIAKFIATHYSEALTLDQIAQVVGINPSYASSIFAQEYHITLWDYLTQYRVAHAQRLLLLTDSPIPTIAESSGFTSISQFYAIFKKHCQQSPKQLRLSAR